MSKNWRWCKKWASKNIPVWKKKFCTVQDLKIQSKRGLISNSNVPHVLSSQDDSGTKVEKSTTKENVLENQSNLLSQQSSLQG